MWRKECLQEAREMIIFVTGGGFGSRAEFPAIDNKRIAQTRTTNYDQDKREGYPF